MTNCNKYNFFFQHFCFTITPKHVKIMNSKKVVNLRNNERHRHSNGSRCIRNCLMCGTILSSETAG